MSTSHVTVFEIASEQNFFPEGYLLANADIRSAYGDSNSGAANHFRQFGRHEARKQVTREFLVTIESPEFRKLRFERFKNYLADIPEKTSSCPIRYDRNLPAALTNESSHPTAAEFLRELTSNPNNTYADIGAGLRNVMFDNCIYVEIYPSLTTDVVILPHSKLPFKDSSLDGIGCYAVLEHVREPWKMAEEFARVLKPEAKLFVDWPFLQPVHGYPSHYYNATPEGVRAMFARDFKIETLVTQAHEGPDFTLSWILNGMLRAIQNPSLRSKVDRMTVAELASEDPQSPFWREVLASMSDDSIRTFSCGNTLIGTRKMK